MGLPWSSESTNLKTLYVAVRQRDLFGVFPEPAKPAAAHSLWMQQWLRLPRMPLKVRA
jgi:hypothetical protein